MGSNSTEEGRGVGVAVGVGIGVGVGVTVGVGEGVSVSGRPVVAAAVGAGDDQVQAVSTIESNIRDSTPLRDAA
jgi:hypothetical protein